MQVKKTFWLAIGFKLRITFCFFSSDKLAGHFVTTIIWARSADDHSSLKSPVGKKKSCEYKLNVQLQKIQESNNKLQEENNLLKVNNKTLKNFVDNVKTKNKNSYIYIATSKQYANQNAFKIGKSDNLKNQL